MSQDVVADAINQIMNAKKSRKSELKIKRHSKLLLSVLAIAKLNGYVKNYKAEGNELKIELGKVNGCRAIKPRTPVQVDEIEKYIKRYLPAKNIGIIILSTSEGLMTHNRAIENKIGGSLLAYFY